MSDTLLMSEKERVWCEVCARPASECLACDKCLTVQCWHSGPTDVVCEERRGAGLISQAEAERRRNVCCPSRKRRI